MKKFFALNFPLAVALTLSLPLVRVHSQTGTAIAPTTTKYSLPGGARAAAERIAAAQMKKDLYYVSSDEMAGRDTPSPGLDATAKFLAGRLKAAKLKPAGDNNTYFQNIEMRRTKVDAAQTRAEMGGKTFRYSEDFLIATTAGIASGSLVYAGHGWVIGSKNIDAYKGVDVRDKIVIVSAGLPQGIERSALGTTITDAENPASAAQKRGARGVIMITNYPDFDRWWSVRRRALERSRPEIVRFQERDGVESKTQLPTIMPSVAMLNMLFDGERQSAAEIMRNTVAGTAPEAFELAPQKRISFTVHVANVSTKTQNVVAVLEGKDPVLKNEYVAVGAHYDHVGVQQPVNGDSIYNGADDDGSGTVAVLALAEALARAPRSRRSILFVWHAAEEKGLKGSEYFVEYPTVPLDKIVAQFNIDMIGRSKKPGDQNPRNSGLTGPHEIYVIGSKMMSTELGELSERVNKSYLNLSLNYLYDRPNDPQRLFYRSDHYNYAKKGIPIIFYFDGIHEDYHRPSDTADKIDYAKMEKVTRTIFLTLSEVANSDARPVVDKPLHVENTER
ncbi:MAG: M20/M25/M40 family metallo-hydrolase [Acidobacteriota bacterium]|nr:M20/M25/M40 family metallo-hydrolase [Acidobacteriota bacterium]